MLLLPFLLFFSQFLAASSHYIPSICNISVSIGQWFKDNPSPGSCDIVKGHFILDKTANKLAGQIFSVFSNLTRIEGCIYIKGYTGSKNLSFFSNLEDVNCDEEEALRYNLTNVIYILVPKLKTMGFNSLKNVTGPGEIYLSYEKEQQNNMGIPDGEQCFSKEEIIFLSYHPQFRRKMYPNCETEDPCFRLDSYKTEYLLSDIPDNCPVFAGLLCLLGPYEQDEAVIQKFQNLTLLIGQLQMAGTLLDRLDTIFPKLQVVYPYRIPNLEYSFTETSPFRCMGSWLDYDPVASQYIHVGMNRFLSNISLPSLLPIRPIDVSLPIYEEVMMPNGFKKDLYLPDTLGERCSYYPQFNSSQCRAFRGRDKYPDISSGTTGLDTTWLLLMIASFIGMFLSIRAMILLKFSDVTECLPYSRYLIILVLATATLTAMENCVCYQKAFKTISMDAVNPNQIDHISSLIFSEFSSIHLVQPFFTNFLSLLAVGRHVCLILIIACYLDTVIYYRFRSARISKLFCFFVLTISIILCFYLNSQLYVAIRGRRPNYSKEPRHIVYMPFVMYGSRKEFFEKYAPSTQFLRYDNEELTLFRGNGAWPEDLELDIWGEVGRTFCDVCDIIMVITVAIFYILRHFKFGNSQYPFSILILLYFQLTINRVRQYLSKEILVDEYCRRATYHGQATMFALNCYTFYEFPVHPQTDPNIYVLGQMEPLIDEQVWNNLSWTLEKLPYLFYPIVSFFCWRFARYHSYLGPALRFRIIKRKKNNLPTSRMESVMDHTELES